MIRAPHRVYSVAWTRPARPGTIGPPIGPTMPETRWRRMFEVFGDALERPAAEREAFLVAACGGDPELRREIDQLLAAHDAGPGVLDRAAAAFSSVTPVGS